MIKKNIESCDKFVASVNKIMKEKNIDGICLFPMLRKVGDKLLLGTLIDDLGDLANDKITRSKYWVLLDMKDYSLIEFNKTSENDYMDTEIIPLDKEFNDVFKEGIKTTQKFALEKEAQYKEYLMNDIKEEILNMHQDKLNMIDNKLIVDNNVISAEDYLISNAFEEINKQVEQLIETITNIRYSSVIYYYQSLIEEIIAEYLDENTINEEKLTLASKILDSYYGESYGIKYFFNI